jgi:hypothetical protein
MTASEAKRMGLERCPGKTPSATNDRVFIPKTPPVPPKSKCIYTYDSVSTCNVDIAKGDVFCNNHKLPTCKGKNVGQLPDDRVQCHREVEERSDTLCASHKKGLDSRTMRQLDEFKKIEDLGETCGGKVSRAAYLNTIEKYFIYKSYDCTWEQEKKLAEATFRTPNKGVAHQSVVVSIGTAYSARGQYEMIVLKDGKPVGRAMSNAPSVSSVSRYGTSYSTSAIWSTNKPISLPFEVVVVNTVHGERILHYRIDCTVTH